MVFEICEQRTDRQIDRQTDMLITIIIIIIICDKYSLKQHLTSPIQLDTSPLELDLPSFNTILVIGLKT